MNRWKITALLIFVLCACLALPAMAEKPEPVTGTTPVVSSLSSIGEFPVLVSGQGSQQGWTLHAQKICKRMTYLHHPNLPSGQIADISYWEYVLTVTDKDGKPVDAQNVSGMLVFPFPHGVDPNYISAFDLEVYTSDSDGTNTQWFSRDENPLDVTKYGLEVNWVAGSGRFGVEACLIEPKSHRPSAIEALWDKLKAEVESHPDYEAVSVSTDNLFYDDKQYSNPSVPATTFSYNRKTNTYTVSGGVLSEIYVNPYITLDLYNDQNLSEGKNIPYTFILRDVVILHDLYAVDFAGHDLTLVLEKTVRGYFDAVFAKESDKLPWGGFNVNLSLQSETSSTKITVRNETTLCPHGGYALSMYMGKNNRLHLTGNGRIFHSTSGIIYDPDDSEDTQIRDYRPVSLHFNVGTDSNAEAMKSIQHMLASNLTLSGNMFSKLNKKNVARVETIRTGFDGESLRTERYLIPVYYSEEALAAADDPAVPRLLIKGADRRDAEYLLVSKWLGVDSDHYELDLVAGQQLIPLTGEAELYMPYTDAITKGKIKDKVITFYHPTMFGDEIYTTHPQLYPGAENVHKLTVTENGLKLNPSQFSPYISVVEDAPEAPVSPSLPQTGDSSQIHLWMIWMILSAAAMLLMRRRTA